jgi:hypothetical protein
MGLPEGSIREGFCEEEKTLLGDLLQLCSEGRGEFFADITSG